MSSSRTPSKRKQAQNRQDSSYFLQQIASFTPDLLFVIDLHILEVLFINNRVEQLLGYEPAYVYEKGSEIFKILLHPEDYKRRMAHLKACKKLPNEEEREVEVRLKTANGKYCWFRIRDKVFKRDSKGAVSQITSIATNIQEQKIAHEKLKEEHRRLKISQAMGHIGSFERDLPGEQLICSEEFFRIHGLEPQAEKISFQQFVSFVHPDEREAFSEAMKNIHANGKPIDDVVRIIRPDQSIRHVNYRADIVQDEQGKICRSYGTIQDITDQLEAQKKLKHNESLMRRAEEVGNLGSYEADLRSCQLHLSDGFYRLFGYEPQGFEPSLKFIDSVSHPEDAQRAKKVLEKAQKDKQPYIYYRRIFLPNGEMRHLRSNGKVICNKAGNAIKFVGIAEDITEQKKAEEQLEENALFIGKIADTTPDVFIVYDMNKKQLKYTNKNFLSFLGVSLENIQNMPLEELFSYIHPEEKEAAKAYMDAFAATGDEDIKEVEFRLRNQTGQWRWFHCRGRIFKRSSEDKVLQILFIMRDVTEEKSTIKALIEAEKLSVKGMMSRTIAHEVRGPAANISLSIEMIQKELSGTLQKNEEAKVFFDIVTKSCDRILAFINDLINIPATEQNTFEKRDLSVLVEEVLEEAQDRIFLKGIQVKKAYSHGYFIKSNPKNLKIAFLNIIINAVEAMEEKKGILQISIEQQEDEIKIIIQDNGHGMTEEQISRIFEVYYTTKSYGMGVGLANVQAILKEHSAQIEVKSTLGKGTDFCVTFPKFLL